MKILNYTATALLIFLIFYLLFIGKDILLPLVIAVTLWYLINLLARAFSRMALGGFRLPMPVSYTHLTLPTNREV